VGYAGDATRTYLLDEVYRVLIVVGLTLDLLPDALGLRV